MNFDSESKLDRFSSEEIAVEDSSRTSHRKYTLNEERTWSLTYLKVGYI